MDTCQIGLTFSLYANEIFAFLYPEQFYKMLEKVSQRRVLNAPIEEKIEVNTGIFNELMQMEKFCHDC